jgi:NAD(P)-dependent dehydrogenase (short-subunit alcohol dehydrogenase family)
MRILVVGATGTIGKAVVAALAPAHEVLAASRHHSELHVDITDVASIRALYQRVGQVDAVVSAAGNARFAPLAQLGDDDFAYSLSDKLMGQVNLVRYGLPIVRDGGSITITSGVLAQSPMPGSAAVSLVNAGLEGFARAAALEAPRGVRVNVVSPGWVTVTLAALGMDPSTGITPEDVARVYVASVTGSMTGEVLPAVA